VKLIVGLGNPGSKYAGTRHNLGFDVIDELARRRGLTFESSPADAVVARERGLDARVMLAKPMMFMNRSGDAVGMLSRYFRIEPESILVVVDDANLSLGRIRARSEGSAGGHNGLQSIMTALATPAFARLRLGVGRGDSRRDLADHVLARFDDDEIGAKEEMVTSAADAAELFVDDSILAVMNRFNARERSGDALGTDTDDSVSNNDDQH
jgi:PTH1 family peptidyl-tRNA hydrolase